MKNLDWVKTFIIFGSVVVAGFFIGNMHKTGKRYDRYVEVKGLSEREVKADLAVWPINISLTGNDLLSLMSDIENQMDEVSGFFTALGFDGADLAEGTTTISDVHADLYNPDMQRSEFRYLAKSEFTVRTREIDLLQEALSRSPDLISKGIILGSKNPWSPIEYIFTGLNEIKPSMIEEATKNAREVAEKFAHDSDSRVGKIRNARQGLFTIEDRDMNTPEIKIIRVVTTIDYQLED